MRPEVVVLGVSDVDGAKAFYQNLGCRCSRRLLRFFLSRERALAGFSTILRFRP